MVGGRIWTFLDIFPDDGEPAIKRDANGKKIIPPIAYYVFGAATFVTVGLSVMIIPYLKDSYRLNRPMQNFIAHRNSGRSYQTGKRVLSSAVAHSHSQSPSSARDMPTIAQALARQKLGPRTGQRLDTTTSGVDAESSNMGAIAADIEPHRLGDSGPSRTSRTVEVDLDVTALGSSSDGQASNMDAIAADIEPHRSLSSPSSPSTSSALSSSSKDRSLKGKEKSIEQPEHPEWPDFGVEESDNQLLDTSRRFNTLEERRLFGSSPAEAVQGKEQIKPSIYRDARNDAFKALGIATGIVVGSAGAGLWIISKILGVSSIDDFAVYMRGTMNAVVPSLVQRVDLEREEKSDHNADMLIDKWLATIRDTLREKPGQEVSLRDDSGEGSTAPS